MDIRDVYDELLRWTPFLAQGFMWNIVISVVAMLLGTVVGAVLAFMRQASGVALNRTSMALTEVARNIPTFVFLFYIAFLVPAELELFGLVNRGGWLCF